MDKNTIIGLLLIGAIIIGFSIYNRPSPEQIAANKRHQDSLALVEKQKSQSPSLAPTTAEAAIAQSATTPVSDFFGTSSDTTQVQTDTVAVAQTSQSDMVVLENEKLKIQINPKGGHISSVMLKDYLMHDRKNQVYLFNGEQEASFNMDIFNKNSVRLSTQNQYFTPIPSADGRSVTMRLQSGNDKYIDFVYTLPANDFMVKFDIRLMGMNGSLHAESLKNFKINWAQKIVRQERGIAFEKRYARIIYKDINDDVVKMNPSKKDSKEVSEPIQWFAFKDQFFTTTIIPDKPFQNVILNSQESNSNQYLKDCSAETLVPTTFDTTQGSYSTGFRYYFGPVHYTTMKAYDKLDENKENPITLQGQVELGYNWLSWINKYFTIPIFNFFLKQNWNMGLIILLLTVLVKLLISPLTFKSYMSSAKMRVLRPQVKAIEEKYPGQDQETMLKRQRETMALYSQVGASPMSGCLPMLLQMPILFALFFFFPSAIELRQQSFLWADDLSSFDSIIQWSGNIPFISQYLGNHISIFCVLMTVVNIIYTKYNMQATDTGAAQGQMAIMKYMMYIMPIFMFFFLNSYPAGLNYYYFISTLFTIIIMTSFKYFVNEEKLLAKLEANKKKPKKKSGFLARLEEAQKMQEKQMRERAKQNVKKK